MSSRPYVADDFDAIRAAGKALGLKYVSGSTEIIKEAKAIDIYYRKIDATKCYLFLSSKRAKEFFRTTYNIGPNKKGITSSYPPDSTRWSNKPADQFVFEELSPSDYIPEGVWG